MSIMLGGGGGGDGPFAGLMGRSAGFFEPGWQPGSGSLSAGAFAAHDQMYEASLAERGEKNATATLEKWALDNGFSVHADGTIYRYAEAGMVVDFVTSANLVDANGNRTGTTSLTWSHMEYKEVPVGSSAPTTVGMPGTWESAIPV